MKLQAYCVYDSAAQVYQRPFFVGADGEAVRAFHDLVGEEGHPVNKHPEDYSLYRVGCFYDTTGEITQEPTLECLCKAWEVSATINFTENDGNER